MSQLINEILLRLSKLVFAGIIAAVVYILAVVVGDVSPSFELAVLCYLAGGVSILMLESSPI